MQLTSLPAAPRAPLASRRMVSRPAGVALRASTRARRLQGGAHATNSAAAPSRRTAPNVSGASPSYLHPAQGNNAASVEPLLFRRELTEDLSQAPWVRAIDGRRNEVPAARAPVLL